MAFDDYYTFDGCAIAVHEFLGEHRLAHRIESVVGDLEGALFRKGTTRWTWIDRMHRAVWDIAAVIPQDATFILIDGNKWSSSELVGSRRRFPFLERDGQYWGKPPDDDTAIRELERLRRAGASFVVLAWPAFWRLSHYAGFHRFFRAQFSCVRENDVIFRMSDI